jgi:hypothetical protein
MDPPLIGDDANFFSNTFDTGDYNDSENKSEDFREGNIQHPYENLVVNGSEPKKPQIEDQEPVSAHKSKDEYHKQNSGSYISSNKDKHSPKNPQNKRNYDSYEPHKNTSNTNQNQKKKNVPVPESYQAPPRGYADGYRPDSRDSKNARPVKPANRGTSEPKNNQRNPKIVTNISHTDTQKRSSSNKERKQQKSSPIRTTKVSGKGDVGETNNSKNNTGNVQKKIKEMNTGLNRTTQNAPTSTNYKEPIHQHANLLKAHNLSLNNFKTEIRLPHAQKFLNETQFVKSPFLSKTLKGMMQNKPTTKGAQGVNYGRLGTNFQKSAGRRKREASAHSNKSKRETSGSHKKSSKQQQKPFNSKKLSFNQNSGNQVQNLGELLSKNAMNTSKIYSRNDASAGFSTGHFLTTSDGILDKRYSNRARQPKQTYYFNKDNRMNKTMVTANAKKTPHPEYITTYSGQVKRSGSGKIKKRAVYPKEANIHDFSAIGSKGGYKLDIGPKPKSVKPKSGRNISRNNKNVAIYTMAPVMTMTYKKKTKSFK